MISSTLACLNTIKQRKKEGLKTYNFGLGQNPSSPPKLLLDIMKINVDRYEYCDVANVKQRTIYGNGLKELIFVLIMSFEGDIVVVNPSWVSYKDHSLLSGKTVIDCNTTKENSYKITPPELEAALNKTSNNKLLILNNPNNPTGVVYNNIELRSLIEVVEKFDNVTVFSDEIYHDYSFIEISRISELYSKTVSGDSISKKLGGGGYRFGWLKFNDDKELDELYKTCVRNASTVYSCPNNMMLNSYLEFSKHKKYMNNYIEHNREIFKSNQMAIQKKLIEIGLPCSYGQSSWYLMVNFMEFEKFLLGLNIKTSDELQSYLTENLGIITVSGTNFKCTENFSLRFSLVDTLENMLEGLDVLDKWLP